MDKQTTVLARLPLKNKARIVSMEGGRNFNQRMQVMGIREGQIIEIVSKQPFMGPLTIAINNHKVTIGRGMAHKIVVEKI